MWRKLRNNSLGLPDFLAVLLEEQPQGFADDLALATVQPFLDHPVHSVKVQPAEPYSQGFLHLSRHDFSRFYIRVLQNYGYAEREQDLLTPQQDII